MKRKFSVLLYTCIVLLEQHMGKNILAMVHYIHAGYISRVFSMYDM